ncbi:hypothetical protein BDZ88DRAFT_480136 [Geranomyces variabilis]|nr:hypothetical protein BDZ88DRAFT_480136 [Geranomyces variabilis]KAJ3135857.1 hypothetical protein HDU90_003597 [Geranomyces variabilis]
MDPANTHTQSEPTAAAALHHQEQQQLASFLRGILAKHKDDDDGNAPRELVRDYKTFGILALLVPLVTLFSQFHGSRFLLESVLDSLNAHTLLHSQWWFAVLEDALAIATAVGAWWALTRRDKGRTAKGWWKAVWKAAAAACAVGAGLAIAQIFGGRIGLQEYVAARWQFAYEHAPQLLHEVQHEHKCCGLNTFNDHAVPRDPKSVTSCINSPEYGFREPCAPAVKAQLAMFTTLQGAAILLVVAAQVLCLTHARTATSALPDRAAPSDAERGLLHNEDENDDHDDDDDTNAQLPRLEHPSAPVQGIAVPLPHALLEGMRGDQVSKGDDTARSRHQPKQEEQPDAALIDML